MPYNDPGQVVAVIVLSAVALWMSFKAGQMALAATRKAALFSKDGVIDVTIKIETCLNTPLKRFGACVAAVGALAMVVGSTQIAMDAGNLKDAIRSFYQSAIWVFTEHHHSDFMAVSYGVPLTLLGLAFSFFYDVGVGRGIEWILHGKGHQRERKT